MAENKTTATDASVAEHLAAIENDERRDDCVLLVSLLQSITGQPPKMWGSSIVGFGSYHYQYDSGRQGEWFRTGFAARKNQLVVYLLAAGPAQTELLASFGKHKMAKSCLSFKRLKDIDIAVLQALIADSLAELKRLYG